MNPTLRGFLIIAAIALTVIVLNLYVALASLFLLAQIAFFLAIAFFIYLLWRERRDDIEHVADAGQVRVLRRRAADRRRDRRLHPRPPAGCAALAFVLTSASRASPCGAPGEISTRTARHSYSVRSCRPKGRAEICRRRIG